jgi:hypothetical protein
MITSTLEAIPALPPGSADLAVYPLRDAHGSLLLPLFFDRDPFLSRKTILLQ